MTSNQGTTPTKKKNKRYFVIYGYMILILLILATGSAYAWLLLTETPRVSNLSVYVNSFSGMQISISPEEDAWSQQLTYEELFPDTYELRPATYSARDGAFYGANYSLTGKLRDEWDPLNDNDNANNTTDENYYCVASFYARTDTRVQVSLAPAVTLQDDLAISGTYLMGRPEWNADEIRHDNGGHGAEYAIRIAINVIRLDGQLSPTGEEELYIYEPNATYHADGSYGYVPTPGIDGTPSLIDEDRIIKQNTSRWGEKDPPEHDALLYHAGSFTGDTKLFTMEEGEVVLLRLTVWLEGRDVDCTNAIADASLFANIQFEAETIGGGGLVPIPKNGEK